MKDDSELTHNINIEPVKSNDDKVISNDSIKSNDGLKSNDALENKNIEIESESENQLLINSERNLIFDRLSKQSEDELKVYKLIF